MCMLGNKSDLNDLSVISLKTNIYIKSLKRLLSIYVP